MTNSRTPHADYGIDAPYVVRNLFIGCAVGLAIGISAASGLWSGRAVIPISGNQIVIDVIPMALSCALAFGFMGCWMMWSSKFGKDRKSTRLNSSHTVISYAVICLKKKS